MDFGTALLHLKSGKQVTRTNWNGKGMFLAMFMPDPDELVSFDFADPAHRVVCQLAPYIVMKTADNRVVPWCASQTDLLAEDWEVIT